MPRFRLILAALLAGLALVAAACGDDNDQEPASDPPVASTPQEDSATETSPVESEAETGGASADAEISKDLEKEPQIPKPSGAPPTELEKEDVVKGDGKTAKEGDNVSVQYTGVSWSTGEKFDASWDRNAQPFTFTLGSGMVIPGWDEGVKGMKEGGRRVLTIPPDLAYGPAGSPPAIGPNETLVFVVDLEKVESGG